MTLFFADVLTCLAAFSAAGFSCGQQVLPSLKASQHESWQQLQVFSSCTTGSLPPPDASKRWEDGLVFSVAAVLTCQDRRHSERVPISPRWQQLGLGLAALPLGAKHFQVVAPLVEHLPLLAPLEGHLLSAVSCRAELQSLYVAQQAPQVANATAAHP